MNEKISLINVNKAYGKHEVLKKVNYHFHLGNVYIIKGKSGIGKTTLFNLISQRDLEYEGSINQVPISYINQEIKLFDNLTVLENILFGIVKYDQSSLNTLLNTLDIHAIAQKKCRLLSGGQKQRVAIARCLISPTPYVLLDEPTKGLDIENIKLLAQLIKDYSSKYGICFLIASHNDTLSSYFNNLLTIEEGYLVEKSNIITYTSPKKFNQNFNLEKTYIKYLKSQIYRFIIMFLVMLMLLSSIIKITELLNNKIGNEYSEVVRSLDDSLNFVASKVDLNAPIKHISLTSQQLSSINNILEQTSFYFDTERDINDNQLEPIKVSDGYFDNHELSYLSKVWKNLFINDPSLPLELTSYNIIYKFVPVYSTDYMNQSQGLLNEYRGLNDIKYGSSNLVNDNDIIIPNHLSYLYTDDPSSLVGEEITLLTDNGNVNYNVVGIYDESQIKDFNELGYLFVKPQVYNSYDEFNQDMIKKGIGIGDYEASKDLNSPMTYQAVSSESIPPSNEYDVISKVNYISANQDKHYTLYIKYGLTFLFVLVVSVTEFLIFIFLHLKLFGHDILIFKDYLITRNKLIYYYGKIYGVMFLVVVLILIL